MLNSAMFRNFQEGNCFEGRQIGMSGYMGVGSYEILVKMRRHDWHFAFPAYLRTILTTLEMGQTQQVGNLGPLIKC